MSVFFFWENQFVNFISLIHLEISSLCAYPSVLKPFAKKQNHYKTLPQQNSLYSKDFLNHSSKNQFILTTTFTARFIFHLSTYSKMNFEYYSLIFR